MLFEAPGERYRLGFRLLARDHRSLRLELSDPFGRPVYYLVFYQGLTKALSLTDKKVVPLNLPALLKAFPLPSETRWEDIFQLFWGRVPLPPGETGPIRIQADRDSKLMQFVVNGEPPQIIRVEKEPFRVVGTEVPARGASEAIQILFSDFIELCGSYWPKKIEARGLDSEKKLTIQYEQIVPRSDIPDEAFLIAEPINQIRISRFESLGFSRRAPANASNFGFRLNMRLWLAPHLAHLTRFCEWRVWIPGSGRKGSGDLSRRTGWSSPFVIPCRLKG